MTKNRDNMLGRNDLSRVGFLKPEARGMRSDPPGAPAHCEGSLRWASGPMLRHLPPRPALISFTSRGRDANVISVTGHENPRDEEGCTWRR